MCKAHAMTKYSTKLCWSAQTPPFPPDAKSMANLEPLGNMAMTLKKKTKVPEPRFPCKKPWALYRFDVDEVVPR
jgi:hypothetical protein